MLDKDKRTFLEVVEALCESRFFTEHEAKVAREKFEMLLEDEERRSTLSHLDRLQEAASTSIFVASDAPAPTFPFFLAGQEYSRLNREKPAAPVCTYVVSPIGFDGKPVPKIGSVWQHKKSLQNYIVLECDENLTWEPTAELAIIYQATGGGKRWVRPLVEFLDKFKFLRNKMLPEDMVKSAVNDQVCERMGVMKGTAVGSGDQLQNLPRQEAHRIFGCPAS